MNEQNIDMLRADAEGLASGEEWARSQLRLFALQVIELCKDYTELDAAYAQLKHQTRGVVFGDRFRAQWRQDAMDGE